MRYFIGFVITSAVCAQIATLSMAHSKTSEGQEGTEITHQESTTEVDLAATIDESDLFFSERRYDPNKDPGGDFFLVSFDIPTGWEVEYIPEIKALNLYTTTGEGTPLDRSQIFLRYFDATSFLTLNTVDVASTEDLLIGRKDYTAKQYEIKKKSSIAPFPYQPDWRNDRHVVTDFRAKEGFTRYYVVAQNPALPDAVYEAILDSIQIHYR